AFSHGSAGPVAGRGVQSARAGSTGRGGGATGGSGDENAARARKSGIIRPPARGVRPGSARFVIPCRDRKKSATENSGAGNLVGFSRRFVEDPDDLGSYI